MYRILLADDEGIMLESLKTIIESNYGKECEIHCAKTGRAVVEQAQAYPPDICFVDIQMPGISGIQAIKEIKKFNSSTVFVVVTAYDKFTYAKEAVNLGVLEFLTKPVNKRVILETCSKAMARVDETRQKRSDDLRIREKLETVVPIIESGYINNILLQDDFDTYQDNYTQLLDIRFSYGYMIVVEFGDSMENGVLSNAVGSSVKANKFYSSFREIAKGFFDCVVGPIMGNRIVLLVPYENATESYEDRVEIVTRTRNMVHKFESRIDSIFRCGIGRVKELGAGMKESFQEALVALRESTSHVVHIEDVPVAQKYDGEYPQDLEHRYQRRVLEKDLAGALNCADSFFEWMLSQNGTKREDVEIKILELIMETEKKAFYAGAMKYNFSCRSNYIKEIQACSDMEGLKNWFLNKTGEICSNMESAKEKEALSIIEKAQSYINENFKKDISLDDVSRMANISPYYFSKLFKQETGKNFIEYLTEIRLRHAKDLLQNSGYSIKEICGECGYSDPNYFSRIFKKYEGVTPSEFRERLG
ncbi:MAG: helix-turn-helix domain-containing protein [Clostridia bacterium]|nr:helix-turn-helix domain-containing protein [Clostridia bacterium]MDY5555391.1 helix-turn-helix domain-containing protein [Blautia sp.]